MPLIDLLAYTDLRAADSDQPKAFYFGLIIKILSNHCYCVKRNVCVGEKDIECNTKEVIKINYSIKRFK